MTNLEGEMDLVVPASIESVHLSYMDIDRKTGSDKCTLKCNKKYSREFSLFSFHFMAVFPRHDKVMVSGFFFSVFFFSFFFEQIKHDANLHWHSLV